MQFNSSPRRVLSDNARRRTETSRAYCALVEPVIARMTRGYNNGTHALSVATDLRGKRLQLNNFLGTATEKAFLSALSQRLGVPIDFPENRDIEAGDLVTSLHEEYHSVVSTGSSTDNSRPLESAVSSDNAESDMPCLILSGHVGVPKGYDRIWLHPEVTKRLFCYAVRAFNEEAADCLHGFMTGDPAHIAESVANGDAKEGVKTTAFFMADDQAGAPQAQMISAAQMVHRFEAMSIRVDNAQQSIVATATQLLTGVQASNEKLVERLVDGLQRTTVDLTERLQRGNGELMESVQRGNAELMQSMQQGNNALMTRVSDSMLSLHREAIKDVRAADQRAYAAESQAAALRHEAELRNAAPPSPGPAAAPEIANAVKEAAKRHLMTYAQVHADDPSVLTRIFRAYPSAKKNARRKPKLRLEKSCCIYVARSFRQSSGDDAVKWFKVGCTQNLITRFSALWTKYRALVTHIWVVGPTFLTIEREILELIGKEADTTREIDPISSLWSPFPGENETFRVDETDLVDLVTRFLASPERCAKSTYLHIDQVYPAERW